MMNKTMHSLLLSAKFKTELNLDSVQLRKVAILLIKMDEKRTETNERLAINPEARRKVKGVGRNPCGSDRFASSAPGLSKLESK